MSIIHMQGKKLIEVLTAFKHCGMVGTVELFKNRLSISYLYTQQLMHQTMYLLSKNVRQYFWA